MAEITDLDRMLRESFARISEPGASDGVAEVIRSRVAAGDTGTAVATATAPGWGAAPGLLGTLGILGASALIVGGGIGAGAALFMPGDTAASAAVMIDADTVSAGFCPGGVGAAEFLAGEHVLVIARSDDSSHLAVRSSADWATTVWLPTAVVVVELVDDGGRSVAYGPTTPGTIWWSVVSIPGTTAEVNVSYRLTLLDDDGRATSLVDPIEATIAETRVFRAAWMYERCVFGEIATDLASTGPVELPDVVPISATFTLRDGLGLDMDADANGFADCDRFAPGGDTITVEASVLLSDLRRTRSYSLEAENDRLRLSMTITLLD